MSDPTFTFQAVFAKHGDCLILDCTEGEERSRILVDGGPAGVYRKFLRKRLQELAAEEHGPVSFDLAMVSHIDADHITGLIDLFAEAAEARAENREPPARIEALWHNHFDDLVRNDAEELERRLQRNDGARPASVAVAQSVAQGRTLRDSAVTLGITRNNGADERLVVAGDAGPPSLRCPGLQIRVIGPAPNRLKELQEAWSDAVAKAGDAQDTDQQAREQAYLDQSVANLSSIVALVEHAGARVLLTGDARGDDILEGLEALGLMEDGVMPVDLLKVPHHGSDRNVETEFFRRIPATHYVICGDGKHGNPEPATLEMIASARAGDEYHLWVTLASTAERTPTTASAREHLGYALSWLNDPPDGCHVHFLEHTGDNDGRCPTLTIPLVP